MPGLRHFELTFRLTKRPDGHHRIELCQAITGYPHLPEAPATELTVFALTVDSQLGTAESSTAVVLEGPAAGNPLLITDPARASCRRGRRRTLRGRRRGGAAR
ncbi:hypothetical protein YIM_24700 [Amycolatopsis sp. YIM 10]|nr:hypothetical protein YIM_24700 [Amycolatopsis sp. YIM 10]